MLLANITAADRSATVVPYSKIGRIFFPVLSLSFVYFLKECSLWSSHQSDPIKSSLKYATLPLFVGRQLQEVADITPPLRIAIVAKVLTCEWVCVCAGLVGLGALASKPSTLTKESSRILHRCHRDTLIEAIYIYGGDEAWRAPAPYIQCIRCVSVRADGVIKTAVKDKKAADDGKWREDGGIVGPVLSSIATSNSVTWWRQLEISCGKATVIDRKRMSFHLFISRRQPIRTNSAHFRV